jgi:hypothetical protein
MPVPKPFAAEVTATSFNALTSVLASLIAQLKETEGLKTPWIIWLLGETQYPSRLSVLQVTPAKIAL